MPVDVADIAAAADRLHGVATRTPVLTSRTLNALVRAEVFLKCENFQRAGAFKFRGAYNALSRLSDACRARGVVTHSSGNHAQAVALASRLLGIRSVIVMPANAPAVKRAATEVYGAKVVEYEPGETTREALSQELAERDGLTLIPPFDHPDIVAGAGTAVLELMREIPGLDLITTPCGGGGLLAGSAVSAKGSDAECRVFGVEPELADDAARSFASGTIQTVHNPPTIADGTRTVSLGTLNFEIIQSLVSGFAIVSESAITDAVRFCFERLKLVVEPSGALGVAALLERKLPPSRRIGIVLSGGNVDPATMAQILAREI